MGRLTKDPEVRYSQGGYTTDVVVEEQEFAESKNASSGSNANAGGGNVPPVTTGPDGFMNIPDGIDEELPFT